MRGQRPFSSLSGALERCVPSAFWALAVVLALLVPPSPLTFAEKTGATAIPLSKAKVDDMIADLTSEDPIRKAHAISFLLHSGSKEGFEALLLHTEQVPTGERGKIMWALVGSLSEPSVRELFARQARSGPFEIKQIILFLAETSPHPGITPAMQELLASDDVHLRLRALKAAPNVRTPELVPTVAEALRDPDLACAKQAAESLAAFDDPRVVPALAEALSKGRDALKVDLLRLAEQFNVPVMHEALIQVTTHRNADFRAEAARILGKMKADAALGVMLQLLKDPFSKVRLTAIEALTTLCRPEGSEAMTHMLGDRELEVRRAALKSLDTCPDPNVGGALQQFLQDERDPELHSMGEGLLKKVSR